MPLFRTTPRPRLQSRAKYQAERRAQQETDGVASLIREQVAAPVKTAGCLWTGLGDGAYEAMHQACADWQRARPAQSRTIGQAAAHETGHFVAYQAMGMVALSAEIFTSSRGCDGWHGYAVGGVRPARHVTGGLYLLTAEHCLAKAVSTLAGPATEHFFSDYHMHGASGEMIETCLLARKLADILGIGFEQAMADVLRCTVALLERHAPVIRGITALLVRRKRIACSKEPVARLLAKVSPDFLSGPWPCDPHRVVELARLFDTAPSDLTALVRRVAP